MNLMVEVGTRPAYSPDSFKQNWPEVGQPCWGTGWSWQCKVANRWKVTYMDSPRRSLSHIAREGTPVPKSSSPVTAPEVSPIVVLPGHWMSLNQVPLHRGSCLWPPKFAHGYWRWCNNGGWCYRHRDGCKMYPSCRVPFWYKPGVDIILFHHDYISLHLLFGCRLGLYSFGHPYGYRWPVFFFRHGTLLADQLNVITNIWYFLNDIFTVVLYMYLLSALSQCTVACHMLWPLEQE